MANYQQEGFAVNGGVAFGGKKMSARAGISIKFFDLLNYKFKNKMAKNASQKGSFETALQPLSNTKNYTNRLKLPKLAVPKRLILTASRTNQIPVTQKPEPNYLALWLQTKASKEALLVQQSFESLKTILPLDSVRIKANIALNANSKPSQEVSKIILDIQLDQSNPNIKLNATLKQDIFNRVAASIPYVKGRDQIVLSLSDFSQAQPKLTDTTALQNLETANKKLETQLAQLVSDYQSLQAQVQALKNKAEVQTQPVATPK